MISTRTKTSSLLCCGRRTLLCCLVLDSTRRVSISVAWAKYQVGVGVMNAVDVYAVRQAGICFPRLRAVSHPQENASSTGRRGKESHSAEACGSPGSDEKQERGGHTVTWRPHGKDADRAGKGQCVAHAGRWRILGNGATETTERRRRSVHGLSR